MKQKRHFSAHVYCILLQSFYENLKYGKPAAVRVFCVLWNIKYIIKKNVFVLLPWEWKDLALFCFALLLCHFKYTQLPPKILIESNLFSSKVPKFEKLFEFDPNLKNLNTNVSTKKPFHTSMFRRRRDRFDLDYWKNHFFK